MPPHRFRCRSWRPLGRGGGGFPAEAGLWPGSRQPRGAARRGCGRVHAQVGADARDCGPNRVREQLLQAAHRQRAGRVCQRAARGRRAVRRPQGAGRVVFPRSHRCGILGDSTDLSRRKKAWRKKKDRYGPAEGPWGCDGLMARTEPSVWGARGGGMGVKKQKWVWGQLAPGLPRRSSRVFHVARSWAEGRNADDFPGSDAQLSPAVAKSVLFLVKSNLMFISPASFTGRGWHHPTWLKQQSWQGPRAVYRKGSDALHAAPLTFKSDSWSQSKCCNGVTFVGSTRAVSVYDFPCLTDSCKYWCICGSLARTCAVHHVSLSFVVCARHPKSKGVRRAFSAGQVYVAGMQGQCLNVLRICEAAKRLIEALQSLLAQRVPVNKFNWESCSGELAQGGVATVGGARSLWAVRRPRLGHPARSAGPPSPRRSRTAAFRS